MFEYTWPLAGKGKAKWAREEERGDLEHAGRPPAASIALLRPEHLDSGRRVNPVNWGGDLLQLMHEQLQRGR